MLDELCTVTVTAALVWFKRDLRLREHVPLAEAMHFESALGLGVIERQWPSSPECDPRHIGFVLDCVAEPQRDLPARGEGPGPGPGQLFQSRFQHSTIARSR
jgi:deoxyribodipyrimidine photolyase